ncbi:ribonuclease catalytic domain-containing protein [Rhodocyclus gracilis]|uniref:RNB domain-containing ribonuclease n=1 Tax=Rhodocyclus tenuis TaxID=1066 RepID=A0A6L5JVZ0_RHOTE|nr:RNB domain-containing ribonuclease [Rhodocyclus gracilis]MQY51525.1 RNB domain-containing ribonuclease [Rhodocyclus gracilis]
MHVLFEEDSAFKTGAILADNDTSLQVEAVSGKRSKIKATNVLLRFSAPAPGELLERATPLAAEIDADFLWECAGDGEFAFADFAAEYYGHAPSAVEATALLLALHAAPIYFHRKGRGRFRKAPPDILAAALAGLEKKRLQALAIERMAAELQAFTLPPEFPPLIDQLLYKADRNRPETKALEAACAASGLSALALLARCGAIRSPYAFHLRRFLLDEFPRGPGFGELAPLAEPAIAALPLAEAPAFSIDDASTTEIDDAFSLQRLPGVGWRVGIHIAAPGLSITPDSPFDAIARERLSTVYMPGSKITMLPDSVVAHFTLAAGRTCPALSLYLTVSEDFAIVSHESRIDRVRIAANLRHHDLEPVFNAQTLADGLGDFPFRDELKTLWQLAGACEARRGKSSNAAGFVDYNFDIVGDLADAESCHVSISQRPRGSPLDMLVAELMIVANSLWGGLLAEQRVPAIYRAQSAGKVRMTTQAAPHDGLGVPQYAWMSSPLRRYVDLVNQRQLIACLNDEAPPFAAKAGRNQELFAIVRDFELAYAAYAEFQRGMERYWSLRWLQQEACTTLEAVIRRDGTARVDGLPIIQRVPSAPDLPAGARIRLSVERIDLLTLELGCRWLETLAADGVAPDDEEPDSVNDSDESPADSRVDSADTSSATDSISPTDAATADAAPEDSAAEASALAADAATSPSLPAAA